MSTSTTPTTDELLKAATARPWKVAAPLGEGDFAVLSEHVNAGGNFYVAALPNGAHAEAEANAELIVRAVNAFEALYALLLATERGNLEMAEAAAKAARIALADGKEVG